MTISLPALPNLSLPSPPLIVRLIWPALIAGRIDDVVAAQPVDHQLVAGASALAIDTCAARPLTTIEPPLLTTLIWSAACVPLTVTVSRWPSPPGPPAVAPRSIATW